MQFLLAAADGTIWNARRYRVAAHSIRIVPWAALAVSVLALSGANAPDSPFCHLR